MFLAAFDTFSLALVLETELNKVCNIDRLQIALTHQIRFILFEIRVSLGFV